MFKCRIEYAPEIQKIEFIPYQLPHIQSLSLVEGSHIEYQHKFADRFPLYLLYAKKRHADDIMILKNGLITDSFFANLAFQKDNQWLTPAQPLLNGTRRQLLLQKGIITPANITPSDLPKMNKVRLFNAMIRWEDQLDVQTIYPLSDF